MLSFLIYLGHIEFKIRILIRFLVICLFSCSSWDHTKLDPFFQCLLQYYITIIYTFLFCVLKRLRFLPKQFISMRSNSHRFSLVTCPTLDVHLLNKACIWSHLAFLHYLFDPQSIIPICLMVIYILPFLLCIQTILKLFPI